MFPYTQLPGPLSDSPASICNKVTCQEQVAELVPGWRQTVTEGW